MDEAKAEQIAADQSEIFAMMNAEQDTNLSQFLSFFVGGEEYGVDILRVQEIKCWDYATEIPNSPSYLKGVINLRGAIVPVIDLCQRFGMDAIQSTATTVVIVVKVEDSDRERTVGFMVEAVSEVYSIDSDALQDAPDTGDSIDLNFVKGLTAINEKMVVLLDIDHLMEIDELNNKHLH